ncbi:MAG TPA: DUF1054 family protein [Candidatus Limnocylindrales bacterium]|nr:DUF1054 family protein [Candidatus Limnocylindrales bacterium]
MSFSGFSAGDFKVFEIEGFAPRMDAIKSRIRPKLEAVGKALLPDVGRIGRGDAFVHVAKHARRTVNPPDDTWVAFACDKRGYKKHCHFKVAVSRGAVRFLFEAGPEHAEKKRWMAAWRRDAPKLVPVLRRANGLAWFKNEHDEAPTAILSDLAADAVARLADELTRTRDGQLVLGRAISAEEAARWKPADYARAARETFTLLAPLYRLP